MAYFYIHLAEVIQIAVIKDIDRLGYVSDHCGVVQTAAMVVIHSTLQALIE
jgi:hypothetical protein